MSDAPHAYRLAAADGSDEWFDTIAAAQGAIASRLSIAAGDVEASRRRISTDPIVVRRADGRWRSVAGWMYKSAAGTLRVVEMIRVDEAQYDHDH